MKRATLDQALANRRRPLRPTSTAGARTVDLEALKGAPAAIRQIMAEHRVALSEAHRLTSGDPDLTPDGQQARYAALASQAGQRASEALAELRHTAEFAVNAVSGHASLPKAAAGVEAMMARQFKWGRVREMLEANIDLAEIIDETDDPETLHALAEELPSFLRINGFQEPRRQAVVRQVEGRLAEVSGERYASAFAVLREADVATAALDPLLTFAEAVAAGDVPPGDGMHAALASQAAAQTAAASWTAAGWQVGDTEPSAGDGQGGEGDEQE